MANFLGITASSGARIKEDKVEEVKKLMDKYDFSCGIECRIDNGSIEIWGDVWPVLWLKDDKDSDDCFNDFLEELSPFLSENLVIHAVGHYKCVFPLSAGEIVVTSGGVNFRNCFECHN